MTCFVEKTEIPIKTHQEINESPIKSKPNPHANKKLHTSRFIYCDACHDQMSRIIDMAHDVDPLGRKETYHYNNRYLRYKLDQLKQTNQDMYNNLCISTL